MGGVSSINESSDAVAGFFIAGTQESDVLATPAEAIESDVLALQRADNRIDMGGAVER